MAFFNKTKDEMKTWYEDRYTSILIQRNFLIIFSTFIALSVLLCLVIIKNLQENKSIEPFLIEYDKSTGIMTAVDSSTKKEYTAQEAVKESYIVQYIKTREMPKLTNIEDAVNLIRVMSSQPVYQEYLPSVTQDVGLLKNAGKITQFKIDILSMIYISPSKLNIKLNKTLIADDNVVFTKTIKVMLNFTFADIDAPLDDMRLNPLGFQVNLYKITEDKSITITDNANNNSPQQSQQQTQTVTTGQSSPQQ